VGAGHELLHLGVLVDVVGHIVLRKLGGPGPAQQNFGARQRVALNAEDLVTLALFEVGFYDFLDGNLATINEVYRPVRCFLPLILRRIQSRTVLLAEKRTLSNPEAVLMGIPMCLKNR